MKGTVIILIRHGHHAEVGRILSGRSDIGLDADGIVQASAVAAALACRNVAAIHSSPRRRAMQTAEPAASLLGLTIEQVDALDEMDFGDWSGRSFAELDGDERWHGWNARRASAATPGGETMGQGTGRAVAHIEAIRGRQDAIACVSHCDIIRGVVAHYLGLGLDHLLRFDVDPGSMTTLHLEPAGGARLVTLNERPA